MDVFFFSKDMYSYFTVTSGKPMLMHGAVAEECSSLLPGNTVILAV